MSAQSVTVYYGNPRLVVSMVFCFGLKSQPSLSHRVEKSVEREMLFSKLLVVLVQF